MLFLTTVKEKYVKMYERFIEELKTYSKAIRILSKGYLPIYLLPPSSLESILTEVKKGNHLIKLDSYPNGQKVFHIEHLIWIDLPLDWPI